ncbi:hypothetical protein Scep_025029 [Stephania cephalantha]|uniref:Small auxin up regulated protein n=1 Tax=Stephania cephalantha TaxID=152367 RepID=A0AAP0EYC8_9MAGN
MSCHHHCQSVDAVLSLKRVRSRIWCSIRLTLDHGAMAEDRSSKVTGIRQIVRLKEILQKWHSISLNTRVHNPSTNHKELVLGSGCGSGCGGISPAINKRLRNIDYVLCDSDEDSSCNSHHEPPPDVPKGYLAVHVGPELRRFIIPTTYLSHSLFKLLLEKTAEEFGFDHKGALTIPCEIETFNYLLKCMDNNRSHDHPRISSVSIESG